ncbi:SDR family oxidoreductase [Roseateles asaccharophilus]|uniref:NAD(P)-dependent dehydrogenase (Short-subunit alcohol dehydrogenase family) n=1 Tax=Roseateles asaccharophilus TaxID=582607 RepID=A0ABU2ADV5_9BURK|nr:SDR family oxidoreductase [Roseateles asaccharophilus]MDR7335290.1 NAD(P)-dependent dehydrogenase (short-subunit alcohol dehydrogenase family) [Roseateles asaccharophilus]
MTHPLQGKIALVTGASRGIGAAIARRLAADGAELVLHYGAGRNEAQALAAALRDTGTTVHLLQADLAAADGGQQLVAGLAALKLPRIDILVNNAGIAVFAGLADTRADDFERLVNVNMRSLFFIAQGVVPLMPAGGRVINIGTAATRIAFPGITAYSGSKGFVDALTLQLAAELGPKGITANVVAPGAIETRMSGWINEPGGKETLAQVQALPGVGQPEHVAGVVSFLAGPDGAWTTGQVIDASGGTKL